MSDYKTDGFNSKDVAQRLLRETDWTQIPNSGLTNACVSAFGTYRDALRVIRKRSNSNISDTALETWPNVPTEEWS
jgi:hypothetical protein